MKIHFYATLRPLVGGKTIEIPDKDGMTIRQMFDAMLENFPILQNEMFDQDGELLPHMHVFLNGRDVRHLENPWDAVIEPDATINIFPPVGGG